MTPLDVALLVLLAALITAAICSPRLRGALSKAALVVAGLFAGKKLSELGDAKLRLEQPTSPPLPHLPPDTVERTDDERQTPKPPRPDPAAFPDDDPDAVDVLSGWTDKVLDE